jgi:hypothetical protein
MLAQDEHSMPGPNSKQTVQRGAAVRRRAPRSTLGDLGGKLVERVAAATSATRVLLLLEGR